jgi:hypothetical protein
VGDLIGYFIAFLGLVQIHAFLALREGHAVRADGLGMAGGGTKSLAVGAAGGCLLSFSAASHREASATALDAETP